MVGSTKPTLDKDLRKILRIEEATQMAGRRQILLGVALVFLVLVWAYAAFRTGGMADNTFVILAAIIGGYMALNIGANDVANNMGPAVGSRALTLMWALVIAAVFESAGAIIAGGEVVSTIKKGIIDPSHMPDTATFVQAMMAALLAAALWINLATYIGAPAVATSCSYTAIFWQPLSTARRCQRRFSPTDRSPTL